MILLRRKRINVKSKTNFRLPKLAGLRFGHRFPFTVNSKFCSLEGIGNKDEVIFMRAATW